MDRQPLDAIVRAIGTARSRRDALRALAAACVGAGALLRAADPVSAGEGKHPAPHGSQPNDRRRKGVTPQISGGTAVPPGKYPFAASIRASRGAAGSSLCSGSLIDPTHVLTAAHCTYDLNAQAPFPLSAYTVLVGQIDRTATNCAACRKRVTAVAVDPSWTGAGLDTIRPYDVAVLTLDSPVAASVAQPIALVGSGATGLDAPGESAIGAGWGITTTGGSASAILLEASFTVLDDASCTPDAATQLCTPVVDGRDTCSGDSGSPLFVSVASAAAAGSDRARGASRRRPHRPRVVCPNGTTCPRGSDCCPENAEFPNGSCVPAGTQCPGDGGGTGIGYVQIGILSGGPSGCPSVGRAYGGVYARLTNPVINSFIRSAAPGARRGVASGTTKRGKGRGSSSAGSPRR